MYCHFSQECAPNVIEFLLVNADNLTRVQFGSTAWFNDATVANVLSKVLPGCCFYLTALFACWQVSIGVGKKCSLIKNERSVR